ncbi:hypothetical protein J2X90_005151 [Variovorax paradoxus]|uniref:hypothetical protein n=1 Tax=Variovorax paradoxus TaxID=34073 RepID=UPI00277E0982|nr:hypothetical protein [Variovorax paradoxus]MDP9927990.1 hypothetical protein [Variovorax paradoxus]MDQ0027316.1 hypothetical protein [Variovorax paradoxus]
MGDTPFSGNGTIGRLHTQVAPTPPRMLQKKDCERIWSDVREAESAMGWIQWIATKDESWRDPWVINARYQECKQWPSQIEEAKYARARDQLIAYDRGELALSAEDAVQLRGAVNKVQSLYDVSAPYKTMPADYMSEPERELFRRSGNNLGMALMPTSIPGVLVARWFGANETVAAQAGLATAGVLGAGSATFAAKGQQLRPLPPQQTSGLYIGPKRVWNFKPPLTSRHNIRGVKENSRPKGKNTVADPSVDMKADVEAINNGQGTRNGNLYTVNGRTYERFDNHLVPHSGPGFHPLDRGEFKALGIFNSQGNTPQAMQNAIRTTNDVTAQRALEIWRLGQ